MPPLSVRPGPTGPLGRACPEGIPNRGRGTITHTGPVGYLAQDSRAADPAVTVTDRVLSARGLDRALHRLRAAGTAMADAARVAAGLGLPDQVMRRPVGTLSGGRRRRVELARILFADHNGTLLLDEPTNNLDPASRGEVLAAVGSYPGAIVMVTHDEGAIDALRPDRVLLLPDADEDLWSEDYRDLASLA